MERSLDRQTLWRTSPLMSESKTTGLAVQACGGLHVTTGVISEGRVQTGLDATVEMR